MPQARKKLSDLCWFLCLALPLSCTVYDGDGQTKPGVTADAGYPPFEDGSPWLTDASVIPDVDGAGPDTSDAGFVPDAQTVDCASISSEPVCAVTPGCQALYVGISCVCNAAGCECQDFEFNRCE